MLLRHQKGCHTVTGRGFDHPSQICMQLEPVAHGGNLQNPCRIPSGERFELLNVLNITINVSDQGSFGSGIGTEWA